jgi:hypothetical protein
MIRKAPLVTIKYDAREIRAVYQSGQNVTQWIRARENSFQNSETSILYSYDAQAGTYVGAMENPDVADLKRRVGKKLGAILESLDAESVLDAGVGEATTLAGVIGSMSRRPPRVLGFDLSLSRLMFARKYLERNGVPDVELFTGALDCVPLADASVDVVTTMHALEPNHGQEKAILAELLRVARRYLVLVEPSYELGDETTRQRIEAHGYVRGLPDALRELGYPAQRVERWELDINPRNQAALIVVEKPNLGVQAKGFVSPLSKRPLVRRPDCWFCPDDGHAFPVISGVPCLTVDSAILASKLGEF